MCAWYKTREGNVCMVRVVLSKHSFKRVQKAIQYKETSVFLYPGVTGVCLQSSVEINDKRLLYAGKCAPEPVFSFGNVPLAACIQMPL